MLFEFPQSLAEDAVGDAAGEPPVLAEPASALVPGDQDDADPLAPDELDQLLRTLAHLLVGVSGQNGAYLGHLHDVSCFLVSVRGPSSSSDSTLSLRRGSEPGWRMRWNARTRPPGVVRPPPTPIRSPADRRHSATSCGGCTRYCDATSPPCGTWPAASQTTTSPQCGETSKICRSMHRCSGSGRPALRCVERCTATTRAKTTPCFPRYGVPRLTWPRCSTGWPPTTP